MTTVTFLEAADIQLETVCPRCKGAGFLAPTGYLEWVRKVQDGLLQGLELAAARAAAGVEPQPPAEAFCPDCDGLGLRLTAFGRDVLRVLRHRYQVLLKQP
jgi:hypothetical protein